MKPRTLFVMDPLASLNLAGDSTVALMAEATARDWPCWWCTPGDLSVDGGTPRARAVPVRTEDDPPRFDQGEPEDRPLGDFDVVWMRKDPPFDIDYVFATWVLDLAPPTTLVLNAPAALRGDNEKLYALRWPELCPPTLITRDIERARRWAADAPHGVVVKPWDGMGGRGVMVTRHDDPNFGAMLELLTADGARAAIVQHYLPEIRQGDKRVILVEGEPVGWMLRVPQPGDHRGNMHVGARVEACELTDRDRAICAAIGPRLREEGLLFVGIDIIGSALTEINVTSPTGIREINRLSGARLERAVSDAVLARLQSRRHPGEIP